MKCLDFFLAIRQAYYNAYASALSNKAFFESYLFPDKEVGKTSSLVVQDSRNLHHLDRSIRHCAIVYYSVDRVQFDRIIPLVYYVLERYFTSCLFWVNPGPP